MSELTVRDHRPRTHLSSRPATDLVFWLVLSLLGTYAVGLDRTYLLDQDNYLAYFSREEVQGWLRSLQTRDFVPQLIVMQLLSEEALWRVWTWLLSAFLDEKLAVLFTVLCLNTMIAYAVARLDQSFIGLVLWFVLPVGFAVTGLVQLRQGFALALMLVLALRARRPLLGCLLASMVHTTFVVPLVFAAVGGILGRRHEISAVVCVVAGIAMAAAGAVLFELFGGRRLLVYSIDEGSTSLNFALGSLIFALPSFAVLFDRTSSVTEYARETLRIASIHVGVTAFLISSVLVFPLGASRVGYFSQLLLIPILPVVEKARGVSAAAFWIVVLFLLYIIAKAALEGSYSVLLGQ